MENKNQPAFPVHDDEGIVETPGLTKREYFAAAALQGLCSNHRWTEALCKDNWEDYLKRLTEGSIEIADEILKKL